MSIIDRIKSALLDQHPELQYRQPVLRMEAGGTQSVRSNYSENAQYYEIETWVQKAVRVWKDNIADKKIQIVRSDGGESETISDHPYGRLLANPNDNMSTSDLWSEWTVDMALGGEHGFEVTTGQLNGAPLEIWPTKPTQFGVKPASGNQGIRYRKVDYYRITPGGINANNYNLPPEEFIHFKFYNPLNLWRGISPLTAARLSVKLNLYASGWAVGFYEHGARPDYALIAPEGLTPDEREEYKAQLMAEHGYDHRFEPIILEEGVTDIKAFSFPPDDMQWLEHKKVSRDEIGAIFGVPDGIMGWGQESYDTQTKLDGDTRALWAITLEPIIRARDSVITRYGRTYGYLEQNESAVTDLSMVAVLQDDISGKVAMLDTLTGRGAPFNLIADFLNLNIEHIPGGDVGYLPFSVVPVDQVGGIDDEKAVEAITKDAPEYGSKQHAAIWKRKNRRNDPFVGKMKRQLKRFLQDQQNEVSRNLRNGRDFGRGQYKQGEIPPINQIFDVNKWQAEFADRFENIVRLTVMSVGQDEIDALNALGADLSDFEGRPDVLASIREILAEHARKTQNTTFIELTELFETAEREGESISAIMERLAAFYGDKKSEYQTERIARTTVTAASNAGDLLAWDQSEVVKSKTWISALLPKRTRDEHADAHGQTVRLHESFDVGGELLRYPGDPQGSAGNVINCLCTQIAEVEL